MGISFCIKVMYNNALSWKVEVCNTYLEKLVDDDNKVDKNVGEVGDPDDHTVDGEKDYDNGDCVDDEDGDDNEDGYDINDGDGDGE